MTADGLQKFMFDREFSDPGDQAELERKAQQEAKAAAEAEADATAAGEAEEEVEAEPELPPPPTFSEEDLARAREEGRQAGREEATRDMAGAMESRIADTLQAINAQMAQVFETYEHDKEQHSRDAVAVASVIVRKLFPAINMEKAMAEIEHMIVEAMKRTSGSPQLMVRVSEDMKAEVEKKARELAAVRGREGTVSIIGDADVAQGDARVEWNGGGMVRDSGFIWREIDEIIERNLGQRPDVPNTMEGPAPQSDAEVENPAPVGENTDTPVESRETAATAPSSDETET